MLKTITDSDKHNGVWGEVGNLIRPLYKIIQFCWHHLKTVDTHTKHY